MLNESNRIVNALWVGKKLSPIELLTIQSFLHHGHNFHLWTYELLEGILPDGVILKDANSIIQADKIFRYKSANKWGHGKGSVAGFSDVFRYKLLYEKGGWWVDMDVVCLKPFDVEQPYFFRAHHILPIVGNVMKCPPKSALMKKCFEEAEMTVTAENDDWHAPLKILNRNVFKLKLNQFIQKDVCNEDRWDVVKRYVYLRCLPPSTYLCLHWMNEEWRSRKIDLKNVLHDSFLVSQLNKYGIADSFYSQKVSIFDRCRYLFYFLAK